VKMKKEIQHIRTSQFVLTYGPGSIIESRNGPRLIPSIKHGLDSRLFSSEKFRDFEISDSRLGIAIKNLTKKRSRIFSLPSNASLGKSEKQGVYQTYIFPTWKICYGRKGGHTPVLHPKVECPQCKERDDSSSVRFVVACLGGHLDDVPWNLCVHSGEDSDSRCNPGYYYWKSGGSSLSDIVIECPTCKSKTNMGDVYALDFSCTCRSPERERPHNTRGGAPFYPHAKRKRGSCKEKMKVIQRQSSSLRMPETLTLLTIPEYDNSISRILQLPVVSAVVDTVLNLSVPEDKLKESIKSSLERQGVPENSIKEVVGYITKNDVSNFSKLFDDLHNEDRGFMDFIYEEYESLSGGARTTDNFRMSPPKRALLPVNGGLNLDVFPVNEIRTITTQVGYCRIPYVKEDKEPECVYSRVHLDGNWWYPGFEGIGEAIFISLPEEGISAIKSSEAFREWEKGKCEDIFSQWSDVLQHPLFVWLHSLSHSIIMTISLYAGYSSASLRERVYLDRRGERGGILIYTTSPGEDGSMGGLVETVNKFDDILRLSIDRIRFCSNDPLCSDVRKAGNRVNGSACHSCLLISETSCEHRNMWLDRHLILGD